MIISQINTIGYNKKHLNKYNSKMKHDDNSSVLLNSSASKDFNQKFSGQNNKLSNPALDKNIKILNEESGNYGKALLGMKKSFRPSFGMDLGSAALFLYGLFYAGVIAMGYKSGYDIEKRNKESQRLQSERLKNIDEISDKLNLPFNEAADYHDSFLTKAAIPLSNDGNEKGLNAVMGYEPEKYKLAMSVIAPIVQAQNGENIFEEPNLPNGIVLYGPPGSGKTYMAEKMCEHLKEFGTEVEEVILLDEDHEQNSLAILDAFNKAEQRFKMTGKYTIIYFPQDIDNFFTDRNKYDENIREVRTLLYCAEKCASKGAIWLATANNPKRIDPAVLRAGRTDIKMPIGIIQDYAVSDIIKYYLIRYGQKNAAENFDYEKTIEVMKENDILYTPVEIELCVKNAIKEKNPGKEIDADTLLEQILRYRDDGLFTLDSEMIEKFNADKDYVSTIDDKK